VAGVSRAAIHFRRDPLSTRSILARVARHHRVHRRCSPYCSVCSPHREIDQATFPVARRISTGVLSPGRAKLRRNALLRSKKDTTKLEVLDRSSRVVRRSPCVANPLSKSEDGRTIQCLGSSNKVSRWHVLSSIPEAHNVCISQANGARRERLDVVTLIVRTSCACIFAPLLVARNVTVARARYSKSIVGYRIVPGTCQQPVNTRDTIKKS
jgi:hypothetical protein